MDPTKLRGEGGDVTDVTHSTAFLSIDGLLEEGKIVEERAAHLKKEFQELHDRVLEIYNHDNFLLKHARQLRKQLEEEKNMVEACGEVARQDDEVIRELKHDLAKVEHELTIAKEKESMLQVEALELDRKKQNLIHEVEDAIAAEEARLKPQIEALQQDIGVLGTQMEEATTIFKERQSKREALLEKECQISSEVTHWEDMMNDAKKRFAKVEKEPQRAKAQADVVLKALVVARKELQSLDDKSAAQVQLIAKLDQLKLDRNTEVYQCTAKLQERQIEVEAKITALATLNSSLEAEMEIKAASQQRLVELQALIQASERAVAEEAGQMERMTRDKDMELTKFKVIEQSKSNLDAEREAVLQSIKGVQRETAGIAAKRKMAELSLLEVKVAVDVLINNLMKQEFTDKRHAEEQSMFQEAVKELDIELERRARREEAHRREAAELVVLREQACREASRNKGRVLLSKNEVHVKEMILHEMKKRRQELAMRLETLIDMFQSIKRERSQKAAQIQAASQRMNEIQEKTKVLENELDVLRRESMMKDLDVAKKTREANELRQGCKNLRVEKNKLRKHLVEASSAERDLKNQMLKFNGTIAAMEQDMLELKRGYEDAVEKRNFAGIQLIDRNDELCILYEKLNIQSTILTQGNLMLNQRQEEMQALSTRMRDVQRQIDVCSRALPKVRDLEEQVTKTLQELDEEKFDAEVLEEDLSAPTNVHRWRHLGAPGGKLANSAKTIDPALSAATGAKGAAPWPSPGPPTVPHEDAAEAGGAVVIFPLLAEGDTPSEAFVQLQRKYQSLEERVAAVKEHLMEKELILEEVTALCNKLQGQAENGREFTLALAKKVNGYQYNIKSKTKRMMATLSELSMVQAASIQLQMEVERLEDVVQQGEHRLIEGLPPTDEIGERVWRDEQSTARYTEMLRSRNEQSAWQAALEHGVRTTAEQRPNAYIPDDQLQLPHPYGKHAPFKPTLAVQGVVHRFYQPRKNYQPDAYDEV